MIHGDHLVIAAGEEGFLDCRSPRRHADRADELVGCLPILADLDPVSRQFLEGLEILHAGRGGFLVGPCRCRDRQQGKHKHQGDGLHLHQSSPSEKWDSARKDGPLMVWTKREIGNRQESRWERKKRTAKDGGAASNSVGNSARHRVLIATLRTMAKRVRPDLQRRTIVRECHSNILTRGDRGGLIVMNNS